MNTDPVGQFTPDGTWYVDHASGRTGYPILLAHGVGLDHQMWNAQAAALAAEHRVLQYDLLGHGRTAMTERSAGLSDFRNQLLALLDHAGVEKVLLVGFSLGGIIAQRFAADHTARLSGLVLMSTFYCRTEDELAGVRARLALTEETGIDAIVDPAIERWFSPEFQRTHPDAVEVVRQRLQSNDPRGYLDAYRVFATAETVNGRALLDVDCPTLVMTGVEDAGATPKIAQRMADDLEQVDLVLLDGLRHLILLEAPDEVTRRLSDFARRLANR